MKELMGVQGKLSVYSHKEQLSSRYLEVMRKKGSLEPRPSVPNFVSQLWKKIRVSLSTIHNANLSHLCVTHNLGVNGTDTVFFSPLTLFVWLHAELNASPVMLQPSLSLSLCLLLGLLAFPLLRQVLLPLVGCLCYPLPLEHTKYLHIRQQLVARGHILTQYVNNYEHNMLRNKP